ncbi:UDP-3-O-(3-hydroxymyristoyl)glucosamine N-acyltransferase [Limnobacter litoralis]|uniref:UDP-3-O-acylglucosamine N-acyltransferase n=1 Tax=Limnobacter litoralis TaxID=481366 RepID=A0ABQ5YTU4_9BURK|nr:UDP-3-O-(3-hydroxymyristoyl)glucosamine N-acyltransferase [Limnobacter litoralis]GLR26323.1 UDP-3-O-acylglucosamine N-acyltransferase [Limnobacter litoralis]
MKFTPSRLSELLPLFGGRVEVLNAVPEQVDLADIALVGIRPLDSAQACHLGFLSNNKLKSQLLTTRAGVVIVRESRFDELREWLSTQSRPEPWPVFWLVADPYLYYARIQQWWVARSEFKVPAGIHPSAVVDPEAIVDPDASIQANAVIGAHAVIAAGVNIGAGVVLGRGVKVGENTRIYPNAVVYDECELGRNCIVHSGAVIGADGFGFAPENGAWIKIPQVGRVLIADEVEIGANTTIDRGALDDTLIGYGVKLDNQIMVAHNVEIGEHTAMAGCVGVAGSTKIGARCTIGGAAMVLGHLNIVEGTHISAATTVMSSITEAGAYTGIFPIDTHKAWEKTAVALRQIMKLRAEVRELKKQ